MPITYTPLRFPGGKSKIYPFIISLIEANDLRGCTYAEAFCGGAGLAMKLLLRDDVSKVVLNDYDPAVYSIWDAVVNHSDELCDYIETVPLDMNQWYACRDIYRSASSPSFALGKAAFYLNRTNRSGILTGGVIGGKAQTGAYKIDARFNRATLCRKVRAIAARAADITLCNLDALVFMKEIAPAMENNSLLYLDPPYVKKGPGLYENSFTDNDHRVLAKSMRSYGGKWMVTYDTDALVNELYAPSDDWGITVGEIEVTYSASSTRNVATERLVLSPGMKMPEG
ncbi:DNA adenine methylase [Olsenella sp. YH-ols2223]|uniref:site-specific DNA-methyltransferase (adenine-specific) n=1 Tax=Olsenella absiana TaxID=3115222 RepID=A0ABU7RC01_9ACTN